MQLIYPETKFDAYKGNVHTIAFLTKVKAYLVSLNKEVLPISIEEEIASETELDETVVSIAMKSFGDMFARKDGIELRGKEFDEAFVEIALGGSNKYHDWEVFWRVGIPD